MASFRVVTRVLCISVNSPFLLLLLCSFFFFDRFPAGSAAGDGDGGTFRARTRPVSLRSPVRTSGPFPSLRSGPALPEDPDVFFIPVRVIPAGPASWKMEALPSPSRSREPPAERDGLGCKGLLRRTRSAHQIPTIRFTITHPIQSPIFAKYRTQLRPRLNPQRPRSRPSALFANKPHLAKCHHHKPRAGRVQGLPAVAAAAVARLERSGIGRSAGGWRVKVGTRPRSCTQVPEPPFRR